MKKVKQKLQRVICLGWNVHAHIKTVLRKQSEKELHKLWQKRLRRSYSLERSLRALISKIQRRSRYFLFSAVCDSSRIVCDSSRIYSEKRIYAENHKFKARNTLINV